MNAILIYFFAEFLVENDGCELGDNVRKERAFIFFQLVTT
jgi:hypothetical protein